MVFTTTNKMADVVVSVKTRKRRLTRQKNHSVEQRRNSLAYNLHRGLCFVKYVNLLNARQNIFTGKQNFPEHRDIDYSKESKMYFYSRILSHSNALI